MPPCCWRPPSLRLLLLKPLPPRCSSSSRSTSTAGTASRSLGYRKPEVFDPAERPALPVRLPRLSAHRDPRRAEGRRAMDAGAEAWAASWPAPTPGSGRSRAPRARTSRPGLEIEILQIDRQEARLGRRHLPGSTPACASASAAPSAPRSTRASATSSSGLTITGDDHHMPKHKHGLHAAVHEHRLRAGDPGPGQGRENPGRCQGAGHQGRRAGLLADERVRAGQRHPARDLLPELPGDRCADRGARSTPR